MTENKDKKPSVSLDEEEFDSLTNELYAEITRIPLYDISKRKEIIKNHLTKVQKKITNNILDLDDSLAADIKNLVAVEELKNNKNYEA